MWYHLILSDITYNQDDITLKLDDIILRRGDITLNRGDITSKARWYHILLINSKTAPHSISMYIFTKNWSFDNAKWKKNNICTWLTHFKKNFQTALRWSQIYKFNPLWKKKFKVRWAGPKFNALWFFFSKSVIFIQSALLQGFIWFYKILMPTIGKRSVAAVLKRQTVQDKIT